MDEFNLKKPDMSITPVVFSITFTPAVVLYTVNGNAA